MCVTTVLRYGLKQPEMSNWKNTCNSTYQLIVTKALATVTEISYSNM